MPALDFGKVGQRNPRGLGVGKRDGDGEIRDCQRVTHQMSATLQVIVENGGEPFEQSGRLVDRRRVGVTDPKRRLDDVLEIECPGVAREMFGSPNLANASHRFDDRHWATDRSPRSARGNT